MGGRGSGGSGGPVPVGSQEERPPDLRSVLLAAAAWAGGLLGLLVPGWLVAVLLGLAALGLVVRARQDRPVLVPAAWLAAATAVACSGGLRAEATGDGRVGELADERAVVVATARVVTDPRLREGVHADFVVVRVRIEELTGRGRTVRTGVPVLVIARPDWAEVELGSLVRVTGRLSPAEGRDLAGVLSVTRPPTVLAEPDRLLDGAAAVRAGIREAVAPVPPQPRTLIPALVVGDDHGMSEQLVQNFQVAGLTHLAAVSGTNLTLVVGALLILARWTGVRARGLILVGALGVAGFVLLARTEPSVVRAAAMGSVALLGMATDGREKGVRALGVAVLVLLLLDPHLALSVGFALSALATAGILFLAPPWRDALMRWLPRWMAEAISVPLAAQLVCTPVVAAISGQLSLVAVVANMLVAPAVGPATVLGLLAGLAMLVADPVGLLVGRLAGWCAWWIVRVAEHSAALPSAAVEWSATAPAVAVLTLLCCATALAMPALLRRRWCSIGVAIALLGLVVRPVPALGWPPEGWAMVACDVGQGDGLVLNAGHGRAVVVDVGVDPRPIGDCLRRLDVKTVPVLVLTHFHADHVAGLAGVLQTVPVGEIQVTGLEDPELGAQTVQALSARHRVPVRVPAYAEVTRVGPLGWQVVGPARLIRSDRAGEEGVAANNASLVLVVTVAGIRILLTGDVEPEGQRLLSSAVPGLRVDVLKVPHHGSRHQDEQFLTGLGARLAVISVGADNEYGHPAPETMDLLERAGMAVRRTDLSGDVAVVVRDGRLGVATLE